MTAYISSLQNKENSVMQYYWPPEMSSKDREDVEALARKIVGGNACAISTRVSQEKKIFSNF